MKVKYRLRMLQLKFHHRWMWVRYRWFREGVKHDRWLRQYFQEHGHLPHPHEDPWYKALY